MDETIVSLIKQRKGKNKLELKADAQTIALVGPDGTAGDPHPVKPLAQLYGNGTGLESVDPKDDTFLPLLMGIEEAILDAYTDQPSLTDASVISALDKLCMTPEANLQHDGLANDIQFALRVALSLNDFSRQDVRHGLRKIKQSANRHNKDSGTRGYLNFIRQMLSRQ